MARRPLTKTLPAPKTSKKPGKRRLPQANAPVEETVIAPPDVVDDEIDNLPLEPEKKQKLRNFELAFDRPLWEQQPGETDVDFRRFQVYLNTTASNRSVDGTVKLFSDRYGESYVEQNPNNYIILARIYRWKQRANAFDSAREKQLGARNITIQNQLHDELHELMLGLVQKIRRVSRRMSDEGELLTLVYDDKHCPHIITEDANLRGDVEAINVLLGSGNAGRFIVDTFKAVFGEKKQVSLTSGDDAGELQFLSSPIDA